MKEYKLNQAVTIEGTYTVVGKFYDNGLIHYEVAKGKEIVGCFSGDEIKAQIIDKNNITPEDITNEK